MSIGDLQTRVGQFAKITDKDNYRLSINVLDVFLELVVWQISTYKPGNSQPVGAGGTNLNIYKVCNLR
jgi:hypothetical protein